MKSEESFYCLSCGAEVNENDNFCKGCGAHLNNPAAEIDDSLIEEAEEIIDEVDTSALNRTVVLNKYSDELSAEIAKQALNEKGISSIISKDDAGGMTPNLQFVSRIRLLVLNKDLKRAKEILMLNKTKKSFDNFSSDMFVGLNTVVYQVDNLEKGKEWYSRALEINPYYEEQFYAAYDVGGYELGLTPNAENISVKGGGHTAYWEVSDIDEVLKHLILIGAQRHEEIKDVGDGILTASVVDPFGNIFGIVQYKNQ